MTIQWTSAAARFFEEATALRDAGRFEEARMAAKNAMDALAPEHAKARGVTEREIGLTYTLENDQESALPWYERARDAMPKSALSSLAVYTCLFDLGRVHEALEEALRFCSIRSTEEYRRMFELNGAYQDSREDYRELADKVRVALALSRHTIPTKGPV